MDADERLTPAEAAVRLGHTEETILRWGRSGALKKAPPHGRRVHFWRSEVERFWQDGPHPDFLAGIRPATPARPKNGSVPASARKAVLKSSSRGKTHLKASRGVSRLVPV